MFISYFEGEPEYRYDCRPRKGFKYVAQINLWDNDHTIEMKVEDFMFPLIAWLVETYGNDPTRYEPIFDTPTGVAFVYFRDNEDRAVFKLIWGENPSEWDGDNHCYKKEGKRLADIL